MDLDPKCIFVQRERNLDVHHPVIKLVASLARNRGVTFTEIHRYKAEDVNNAILKELKKFVPKAGMAEVCASLVNEMYTSEFSSKGDNKKEILSKIESLNNRIKTARELLLDGSLDGIDYKSVKSECEEQITKLEAKLLNVESPKINIEFQLKKAVDVLLNLDLLYQNGKVALKREIIGSIFPEKLSFDGEQHRTTRINEAVSIIYQISSDLESKKSGQTS